jgi:thioredoxin 1
MITVTCGLALACGMARPASRDIYPDPARAKPEIAAALKEAAHTHKRVLVVFGGNWCADCIVLDTYLHSGRNTPILNANFLLVHVNVGEYDANLDLAQKYNIPLEKGVPAVAVLSDTGKLLYSQKGGEFEAMRRMDPSDVTKFLVRWEPGTKGCSVVEVSC